MPEHDDLSVLNDDPFKQALSQFEELLIQSRPAFLLGAGCSKCVGIPLAGELTSHVLKKGTLDEDSKIILESIENQFCGAGYAQIEDYLSELIDLLAIAERRRVRGATRKTVSIGDREFVAKELRNAVEQIKQAIASAIESEKISIETHRNFVAAVHRPVRVGKQLQAWDSVDYLILNYDTVIEDALALEKISYSDGIEGGVTGWWSPQTFDRKGLEARVFKLHGSINWYEEPGDPLPRRVSPNIKLRGNNRHKILIWPASTKYRETQLEPFAQLADRARGAMRPELGRQRALVICGYSFRDEHINREVERALQESKDQLTVVAFTDEDELTGVLQTWNDNVTLREQVLIFGNRGFFHGETKQTSDQDLPWWKFENITRILKGER